MRGRIKFYDENRGFGFVQPDDGSGDTFLHVNDVCGTDRDFLTKGATVEYEPALNSRRPGFIARNVRVIAS
jgi:CspA family cold shock protein